MSIEFTEHELAMMEKMTPQHKALMETLTPAERKSFEKNVKADNVETIQEWVGTDEELQEMLFWVKSGKFDDEEWDNLKPACDKCAQLLEKAKAHYAAKRLPAATSQRKNDLTLYSQFNEFLLYSGVAPAVRCDEDGKPSEAGTCFSGVEFRVIGSIDEVTDSLTIMPKDDGYEAAFGAIVDGEPAGVQVYIGDNYSLQQLAQLIKRRLLKNDYTVTVKNSSGSVVEVDARELRKSGKNGPQLGWGRYLTLYASKKAADIDGALEAGDVLVKFFYERFGLERECINNGRHFGNFEILRDENFAELIAGQGKFAKRKGLVMLTATLVCRRCRREMKAFRNLAKAFPDTTFALVNLNSPLFTFYDRVFGDMGGGNADDFRKNAAGVTPFTIIYARNADGVLEYREYYGTGKAEASPEYDVQKDLIEKHLYS